MGFFLSPFLSDMVPFAPLPESPFPESPLAPFPDILNVFQCDGVFVEKAQSLLNPFLVLKLCWFEGRVQFATVIDGCQSDLRVSRDLRVSSFRLSSFHSSSTRPQDLLTSTVIFVNL